jgi:hypothetical protein
MLVVDRRDDQSAYALGANRAEVEAERERHFDHNKPIAAPVQVEEQSWKGDQGVL